MKKTYTVFILIGLVVGILNIVEAQPVAAESSQEISAKKQKAESLVQSLRNILEKGNQEELTAFVRENLDFEPITGTFRQILQNDVAKFEDLLVNDFVKIYGTPEKEKIFRDLKVVVVQNVQKTHYYHKKTNKQRPLWQVHMAFSKEPNPSPQDVTGVILWLTEENKVLKVFIKPSLDIVEAKRKELLLCFTQKVKRDSKRFLQECFLSQQ